MTTDKKPDDFAQQMALLKVNEILARLRKQNPDYMKKVERNSKRNK